MLAVRPEPQLSHGCGKWFAAAKSTRNGSPGCRWPEAATQDVAASRLSGLLTVSHLFHGMCRQCSTTELATASACKVQMS